MSDAPVPGTFRRSLRLASYGVVVSGLSALSAESLLARPRGVVVFGLGGLSVAAFAIEGTRRTTVGLSGGLLVGCVAAWLWPLAGSTYVVFGVLSVLAGGFGTVLFAPSGRSESGGGD